MFKLPKKFIFILFFALILRLFLAFWSLHFPPNTDILRYKAWVKIGEKYGFSSTYKKTYITLGILPNNQPPGTLYILEAAYNMKLQTVKLLPSLIHLTTKKDYWIFDPLETFFLRIPSILADILLGLMIYFCVKLNGSQQDSIFGSSLFLFNPVVIYNSSIWGQIDAINNLVFFIALFMLLTKKYFLSIFFFFLSLYIKFSLLPILPVFFIFLFFQKNQKKITILLSTILVYFSIYILTLPFSSVPNSFFLNFFKINSIGELRTITVFAFNFWWFVIKPNIIMIQPKFSSPFLVPTLHYVPSINYTVGGITLPIWGYLLFIIFLVPVLIKECFKKEKIISHQNIFLISILVLLLSFLFLPFMHERYFYPIFPLLSVYIGMKKKYLFTYISLSLLNFINLIIVWNPTILPIFLYIIFNNRIFQWLISFVTLIISVVFYISSLNNLSTIKFQKTSGFTNNKSVFNESL